MFGFSTRVRRVLVLAQEQAQALNHSFIGTEHVLLGLIEEGTGPNAQVFESCRIMLDAARDKVIEIIGLGVSTEGSGSPPLDPRTKKVLQLSRTEAQQLGHDYVDAEHILLGLVHDGKGVAAQVLVMLGADLLSVRQQILQMLSDYRPIGVSQARTVWVSGLVPRCASCGAAIAESALCGIVEALPDEQEIEWDCVGAKVICCENCGTEFDPSHRLFTGDIGTETDKPRGARPPRKKM